MRILFWRSDWYEDPTASGQNVGNVTSSSGRAVRGGNFYSTAYFLRVANRGGFGPADRSFDLGFHCARTP
ncbi:MAG: hypothetical protein JW751_02925 [Polyangiaceae bacterium]|nr:hypothetical protein [Polyangiaceae bacterium]